LTPALSGRHLYRQDSQRRRARRPTKFEVVIHLKTTKALGFDVPPAMPTIAGEVIE
jgi:hypothetical protein